MKEDLKTLESALGVSFKDQSLLKQALIHRSYVNEHKEAKLEHNERFEFLGDAVLQLAVTDFLFHKYPDKPEGELSVYRAAMVNAVSLSELSTQLGVNDYLYLSKGEAQDTGRARQFILTDAFEAIIGAIYLDQGYTMAQKFIADHLFHMTEDLMDRFKTADAKSHFQEEAQKHMSITPRYELIEEKGPENEREFVMGVYLENTQIATGKGRSKREAEQDAAQSALEAKNW